MISLIKRFLKIRIIRYGLVGGIGIPVNELALFGFTVLFTALLSAKNPYIYAIAAACAFEVSNIVNFVLNQLFTYREQVQHIHGWEWVRRGAKGQLTSLSAMLLSYAVGLVFVYVFHISGYIGNFAGIVVAFVYNFFISNKLVFRPTAAPSLPGTMEDVQSMPLKTIPGVESSPKR
jgi:putative flippase GtrA